jgi:hypothetical protein
MKDRSANPVEHHGCSRRRATHCHRIEVRDFVSMLGDQFRHLAQQTASDECGRVLPGFECYSGCLDGFVDVSFITLADIGDFLLSGGVEKFKCLSRDRGDELRLDNLTNWVPRC